MPAHAPVPHLRRRVRLNRSNSAYYPPSESEDSEFERARPRSYSLHPIGASRLSPSASTHHSDSLLNSLDLSGSLSSLRQYLLGRLEQAEDDLEQLRVWYQAEAEGTTTGAEEEDDEGQGTDHEWEIVTRKGKANKKGSPAASPRRANKAVPAAVASSPAMSQGSFADEITPVKSFIETASDFLSGIRTELPSLSSLPPSTLSSPSSPIVQFHLSPEARQALDRFLDDHPLPSFPHLDLRARLDESATLASESATALLTRVSTELTSLQQILTQLTQLTPTATPSLSSYIPSLPSTPGPGLTALRDYFSAESDRLSASLSSRLETGAAMGRKVRQEASAGLALLVDEATELGSKAVGKMEAGLDEAGKMYQAALEFGRERLLEYSELPHDWRNNEHILSGYRYITIDRWPVLLRSAFEWHNETINIQSHFLGFLSLLVLAFYILPGSPHYLPESHWGDTAIAILFIGAAMKCLLCSAAWHLLSGCATPHWFRGAACVDYVGISGLIGASVASVEYYSWYYHPTIAISYMTFSGTLAVLGMYLACLPVFNERSFKGWRIAFFLSLAGSAVVPMAHAAYNFGAYKTLEFLLPVMPSLAAYLIGLTFYAHQFPECAAPGYFDSLLASHQLWHASIVAAVWLHWRAITFMAAAANAGTDLSFVAAGV